MTPSTSRHVVDNHDAAFDVRHVTSRPRTLRRIYVVGSRRRLRRRRRCGHVLTSSCQHREHLPEIKIRLWKASEFTILIFEITFFLKTDKLKSAFKFRLTSPGRKLWPILVLLYSQVNKLI